MSAPWARWLVILAWSGLSAAGCERESGSGVGAAPPEGGRTPARSVASPGDSATPSVGEPDVGPGESLDGVLAVARRLAGKGFHVEAARELRRALRRRPEAEHGALHAAAARSYHQAALWDAAIDHAREATRRGRWEPDVLYSLGDSLRRVSQVEEAERILAEVLGKSPAHRPALLALASLRLRTSGASAALELLERYRQVGKAGDAGGADDAGFLLEYGRALRAAGRLREAADVLVGALEEEPLDSRAVSELARTLYRLRRRRAARLVEEIHDGLTQSAFAEHVAEELRKAGAAAQSLAQRAINLASRKKFLGAYGRFRRALEIAPHEPRITFHFASLCLRLGRLREAAGRLDEALRRELRPASGLYWLRSRIHLERGEATAALEAAERAGEELAGEGDLGGRAKGQAAAFELHLARMRAAVEAGDLARAALAVERARQAAPDRWEPEYWRGRVELAGEKPAKALAHFAVATRRGVAGQGSGVDLIYWNGVALEKSGHPEDAVRQLEQIVRRNPEYVAVYGVLGRLLQASGAPAERLEELRRLEGRY
ncbi:MAG: tetratricopeptide repeat protein, partial [Planctomycetota bacterium]|nr:tetratricopeptide repeat protein [Planctomycetota bacterium]